MNPQEQAKKLYETHPAKQVAQELGVSEATIRRWVKGVKKPRTEKYGALVAQLYTLAVRPEGVGGKEEKSLYMDHFGYGVDEETGEKRIGITDSQKSYIRSLVKEKAVGNNEIALFVPEWVALQAPRTSFNRMLEMTNDLYERMQEYLSEYMVEFNMPKDSRYAVEQQLLTLLVPKYSSRSVQDVCHQAANVVDQLERNLGTTHKERTLPKEVSDVYNSLEDIKQFIY